MNIVTYGYGAMGKLLAEAIEASTKVNLVAVVDSMTTETNEKLVNSLDEIKENFDVIIDFSHFSNLDAIVDYCLVHKTATLIATTGHSDEQLAKLDELTKVAPVLLSSNTSLGVNLLNKLMGILVPVLNDWDIELIEKHHNKKGDSPSGTAKTLLEKINEALESERALVHGRDGFKKREKEEIGVHAVRGGTIVGEHSVIFAGEDEVIEIKHEAHSKKVFVNGAIKGAVWVANKEAGLYSMDDVLFG